MKTLARATELALRIEESMVKRKAAGRERRSVDGGVKEGEVLT
jgi:hypothetical protein